MVYAKRRLNMVVLLGGYLTILSLWAVCGLYARFAATDSAADSGRTAAFVFDVTDGGNTSFVDVSEVDRPGKDATYQFTVTNSRNDGISEVNETYCIEAMLCGSLPLAVEIYDAKSRTLVLSLNGNEGAAEGVAGKSQDSGEKGVLKASVISGHEYKMVVSWPEESGSVGFAKDGRSWVELRIKAEQAD